MVLEFVQSCTWVTEFPYEDSYPFLNIFTQLCTATSRKVAGSIPDGVIGIFH